MRPFWCRVQRNHPELDEVQREIYHKDPRVFLSIQRPEVQSLKSQGSALPVSWRQAALFAPQPSLPLSPEPLLSLDSVHL